MEAHGLRTGKGSSLGERPKTDVRRCVSRFREVLGPAPTAWGLV